MTMEDKDLIEMSDGILTGMNGIPILFPSFDRVQLVEVLQSGAYQFCEFQQVMVHLRKNKNWKGNIILDIGSNVGTHTIYALRELEIAAAVSVEPSETNVRFLKMNLALNGFVEKTRVIHAAVCDFNGETEIVKNPVNCGDYRLVRRKEALAETGFSSETSPAITLDTLLDLYDADQTAILWMDTQGSEGLVLGSSERIKSCLFPMYIEFWPHGLDRLDSYVPLRRFILEHVKSIVRFVGDTCLEYAPEQVDEIYNDLKSRRSFCNLLLMRFK